MLGSRMMSDEKGGVDVGVIFVDYLSPTWQGPRGDRLLICAPSRFPSSSSIALPSTFPSSHLIHISFFDSNLLQSRNIDKI